MSTPPDTAPRALEIRETTIADLGTLAGLERESFPDPWPETELATLWGSGAFIAFVAGPRGASPGAYAIFQLLPGEVELLRIGVRPAARGRGLGSALLLTALDRLADRERPLCHLEVRTGNLAARRLYEGLGFEVVGHRRRYYADGEDAVRYRRETPERAG